MPQNRKCLSGVTNWTIRFFSHNFLLARQKGLQSAYAKEPLNVEDPQIVIGPKRTFCSAEQWKALLVVTRTGTMKTSRCSTSNRSSMVIQYSTISLVLQYSSIPVFQYSSIPVFQYSSIPVFQYSSIPVFQKSSIPVIQYSSNPVFWY